MQNAWISVELAYLQKNPNLFLLLNISPSANSSSELYREIVYKAYIFIYHIRYNSNQLGDSIYIHILYFILYTLYITYMRYM